MTHRLTTSIASMFGAFALLIGLSAWLQIAQIRTTQAAVGDFSSAITLRLATSGAFNTHVAQAIRELQTAILTGDPDELAEAAAARDLARGDLASLVALGRQHQTSDELAAIYRGLDERRMALLGQLDALADRALRDGGADRAIVAEIEALELQVAEIEAASRAALDRERSLAEARIDAAMRQIALAILLSLGALMALVLAALAFVDRAIARPIRELADAALGFARNGQPVLIGAQRRDEIGSLQRSFNTLVATICQQTEVLREQAIVAEDVRAQARAAQRLADDLAERNGQIAAQAAALQAEISQRIVIEAALIQARDAAQMASQAKSAFLATVSHELRTPLSAILGYAQLLDRLVASGDYSRLATDLSSIQRAGWQLLGLIDNLLALTQTEAGQIVVDCRPFGITGLIHEAADTARPLIERNQNMFEVYCAPDLDHMTSDAARVRQIVLNLLSNAAKFTRRGQITLSAHISRRDEMGYLYVSVTDTGAGIAPDQISRLFQPFAQLDSGYTRRHEGMGIGLILSQRFATLLGGTIMVSSVYGFGSTFTLELPLVYSALPA